ncbi:MAG: hypothetical protein HC872_02940 [Gammaproteobacteria bacterium]|nr:hypothetical protein [Gammaproteobacteria bacterium]
MTGATLLPIDPGLVNAEANSRQYIRNANADILRSNPSPAVAAYIRGLYNGTEATGEAIEPFVPAAWSQHRSIYLGIVKPNCAMCHLAQTNLSFMSAAHLLQNKSLVYNSVCGPAKTMPHAEVPYVKFWTQNTGALFMPGVLRTGWDSELPVTCPSMNGGEP